MPSTAAKAVRMNKKDMEKYRRLLEEKKASLSSDLAKTRSAEEETTEEAAQDIADKAVSSYTREFLYTLTDGERSTLLQIDDALTRIDDLHGLCNNCAQAISEKRLSAVPWTPYRRLPGARREECSERASSSSAHWPPRASPAGHFLQVISVFSGSAPLASDREAFCRIEE
jgi:DnaK suppressor protein